MDLERIELVRNILCKDKDIGEFGIKDYQAVRYYDEPEELDAYRVKDIRPPFFRDVDRIAHSKAYSRYIDKTQVFFDVNNANVTHRSLHVILVSRIARQIGRVLRLNTDLIEAIALGHDIGHTPYGHVGEEILDTISQKYGLGTFSHNAQSIRWLSFLEKRFPKKPARGLNLTLHVLDGILCHDGEVSERTLAPIKINGKDWKQHFKEYEDSFRGNTIVRIPMSYEGCAVRFADTISYIGRDIEDAILLKFIHRNDIPESCVNILGDTNRKIMNSLIMDLLDYSLDHQELGYTEDIFNALIELKQFNYEHIYNRRDLFKRKGSELTFVEELREKFKVIFDGSYKDLEEQKYDAPIFVDHIEYIDDSDFSTYYKPNKDNLALIVRDYIAGMSDKYFKDIYAHYKK